MKIDRCGLAHDIRTKKSYFRVLRQLFQPVEVSGEVYPRVSGPSEIHCDMEEELSENRISEILIDMKRTGLASQKNGKYEVSPMNVEYFWKRELLQQAEEVLKEMKDSRETVYETDHLQGMIKEARNKFSITSYEEEVEEVIGLYTYPLNGVEDISDVTIQDMLYGREMEDILRSHDKVVAADLIKLIGLERPYFQLLCSEKLSEMADTYEEDLRRNLREGSATQVSQ